MNYSLKEIKTVYLVGKSIKMSFAVNKTAQLWSSFMPFRNKTPNRKGDELYAAEVYNDVDFFTDFDASRSFQKWAAVQVETLNEVPEEMKTLEVSGLYMVFNYKGKSSEAASFYQSIFSKWVPASGYTLDNRPHVAVMGKKYKNDDPSSEEEIWIPVKKH
ncbi:GyrI-like domain-containing protein [Galbibacter pacificus]|uniref:GyrI-like domain-containing protein n=1 Tax=Galbibacter pacificus TaxID=2996052 RepID=A0ABT6FP90_9FLAO|nr:GyrI-like domain-containing protein [Galbibacter pacificus]MDG3581499.1 GyrI-like domain-containing protein [Galbibacter pacificus]MDG3584977.1 GyrI-like domain-containing protein [Galbibacter pacificus]